MIDLELDVHEIGVVQPSASRIFHTNHYLCPALKEKERLLELLPDSLPRLATGTDILGNMSSAAIAAMPSGAQRICCATTRTPRHRSAVTPRPNPSTPATSGSRLHQSSRIRIMVAWK